MYGLNGRTHHAWRPLNVGGQYFTFHPSPSEYLPVDVVEDYRAWMLNHNELGRLYKMVQDLKVTVPQQSILIHPDDHPSHTLEPFALMGSAANYLSAASVECMLFPHQDEDVIYVPSTSSLYDSAQYPLLFPSGWGGWWRGDSKATTDKTLPMFLPYLKGQRIHIKSCISVCQYVKYVTFQRTQSLCLFSTAYQQWLLDSFSRWQSLVFANLSRNNAVIGGIRDRVASYAQIRRGETTGRPFMLPVSIPGSPAAQKKLIADGMAVIAKKGKPTLFITFTGNAQWPEFIQAVERLTGLPCPLNAEALFPDILVRIFRQKLLAFEDDLRKQRFFGFPVIYMQRTIETQKRFIPHAHIILKLACPDPIDAVVVDTILTTRLFFHEHCPLYTAGSDFEDLRKNEACTCDAHALHRSVFKKMRHTKCTDRCKRRDGKPGCKYGYPFCTAGTPTASISYCDGNGYWKPKRLFACDESVVAYNPYMVIAYDCHINVEVCAGIHVVRYIRKYISKLPCSTRVTIEEVLRNPASEFSLWQKLRHVGVSEALLRMKEIDINLCIPSVTALKIHDEGQHPVYYSSEDQASEAAKFVITPLMRYFSRHVDLDSLTYEQYYEKFTLCKELPRKNGRIALPDDPSQFGDFSILFACERTTEHVARIDCPTTNNSEFNALVAILRRYPRRSWQGCLKVGNNLFSSYTAAAEALGIYRGGDEFSEVFQSVINPNPEIWKSFYEGNIRSVTCVETPHMLRILFVCLCISGASALTLLEKFSGYMALDAKTGPNKKDFVLHELSLLLLKERLTLADIGLSEPMPLQESIVLSEERSRYPKHMLESLLNVSLSKEQKTIMRRVTKSTLNQIFYIGAKAGRGKTRLANAIISWFRLKGRIVMIGCPSAKAATHFLGASTLHKLFGIPFEMEKARSLSFMYGPSHPMSILLVNAALICIDEFAMTHSTYITFIDAFLKFLMQSEAPFGGKRLLACGDFTQLAPVDTSGADISGVSPLFHPIFRLFHRFTLSDNFRQASDPKYASFCNNLSTGRFNGCDNDGHYDIKLPSTIPQLTDRTKALDQYISFDSFPANLCTKESFLTLAKSRLYLSAIVAYRNSDVSFYNDILIEKVSARLNSTVQVLEACEIVTATQSGYNFATPEYMQCYDEDDSIPPHSLKLFVGCPVYLVRNFLPSQGLVNGAKFIIYEIHSKFIKAINVTPGSAFFGESSNFFRFAFPVKQPGISFSRQQFPFKVAFASTVHKLQGDTIDKAGFLLLECDFPSFCHAQLYVAFTRAQTSKQTFVVISTICIRAVTLQALVKEDPLYLYRQHANDALSESSEEKEECDPMATCMQDWTIRDDNDYAWFQ